MKEEATSREQSELEELRNLLRASESSRFPGHNQTNAQYPLPMPMPSFDRTNSIESQSSLPLGGARSFSVGSLASSTLGGSGGIGGGGIGSPGGGVGSAHASHSWTAGTRPPARVAYVQQCTQLLLEYFPHFWRLGDSYVSGTLFPKEGDAAV